MNNKIKKPPIKISELKKDEEGEHKRGDLSYVDSNEEKGGGKFTFQGLPQILLSCIISIAIAAFLIFQLAPGKGDFQTLEDENAGLKNVVTELEGKLGKETGRLETVINTMGEYAKKTELGGYATKGSVDALSGLPAQLDSRFDTLSGSFEARFASLEGDYEERIAALEAKVEEEEEEAASGETTRWSFKDVDIIWSSSTVPSDIVIDIEDVDPRRIEEEGLYEIELVIENIGKANWAMGKLQLELVLVPRDYTPINEDDTYLDTDSKPYALDWDADFTMKTREGKEVCRRIIFTSDKYDFKTTLKPGDLYELNLVLELYYK